MRSLLAIVVLSLAAVFGQVALSHNRPVKSPAMAEGILSAFGGLRSLVAEVVWFRADRLQEAGRYVELAQLAHALALAEPHTPEIWSYAAWNLAYNVSVMMATDEDRWRWVMAAICLLRDDGIRLNPASASLHRDLAWMFELKIGANLDSAAPTYRRLWREKVEAVAARGAWDELGMDPMLMNEVERDYGIDDRADALYSAVYWAHRGLKAAGSAEDGAFLAGIVRQSLFIYAKNREEAAGG